MKPRCFLERISAKFKTNWAKRWCWAQSGSGLVSFQEEPCSDARCRLVPEAHSPNAQGLLRGSPMPAAVPVGSRSWRAEVHSVHFGRMTANRRLESRLDWNSLVRDTDLNQPSERPSVTAMKTSVDFCENNMRNPSRLEAVPQISERIIDGEVS